MKRLNSEAIIALYEEHGVIMRDGHFVYASGWHGPAYANVKALLDAAEVAALLAREVVLRWLDIADAPYPQIVAGPATGGARFAEFVAGAFNELSQGAHPPVIAVSIDKDGAGGFRLTEAATEALSGRTVLLTEDVITTSKSVVQAAAAVARLSDVRIVGAFVALNRSELTQITLTGRYAYAPILNIMSIPLHLLATLPLRSYAPDECPLCAAEMPINTQVGHGAAFLAARSDPAHSS